jgi:glycerol-3-phosphate dehydrogenase (NAD(P)+)
MKIAVLGSGAWGTALAASLCERHETVLWARSAAQASELSRSRCNSRYLPDIPLPATLSFSADLPLVLNDADLILAAVPSGALRPLLREAAKLVSEPLPMIWACKGFESGSRKLPHEVVAEEWPTDTPVGVLSGPSFAKEVALGLPTALTLASPDQEFAQTTAQALRNHRLRVYASNDLVGVELGGAVKNVLAIAAGISDGMGFGHNARAALLTRGLAEIVRLGLALGGRQETFMGLAGMGDLILTCTGELSRNRRVGLLLAEGRALTDITRELGHVAEGVPAAREVARRAAELGIEMPITRAVTAVLDGRITPRAAVEQLMARDPKHE